MIYYLHENWKFKSQNKFKSRPGLLKTLPANVPGTIHTDLLKSKIIDDPFYADNETKLGWIHEQTWVYENIFDLPQEFKKQKSIKLVFEGLDTVTEIRLNNKKIAETDNMFLKYIIDISQSVNYKQNRLQVIFHSPVSYAKKMKEKYGMLSAAQNNERVYLRKAQYSFGWDWGPAFPTVGIWRPVYLLQTEAPSNVSVLFDTLNVSDSKAKVKVRIYYSPDLGLAKNVEINLSNYKKLYTNKIEISGSGEEEMEFEINDPDLWWPNGHGAQNLYKLQVLFKDDKENVLGEIIKRVGIRTVELKKEHDGKAVFCFVINGKAIYSKGANWIPSDSFITRLKPQSYKKILTLVHKANMNMIRVWGGGIYEQEIFYELCDQLGLLVWQDFMFACAAYHENDEFLNNVKNEIDYNVKHLQHHPSIAIWCGNNENEWIWNRDENKSYKKMPGYNIFHELIPGLVRQLDSTRPYWPSSPFSDTDDPNDMFSGNQHSWNIWSGWVDYADVKDDKSLFVSEFGFQAPANIKTFEKILPKKCRNVHNEIFEFHNKQIEGQERLFRFLAAHLPVVTKWEDFIYLTQLNQGFALKTSLEHWRKSWPETSGSIIWQLNDCWPVTSWSIIDSGLIPKMSYYFVKESFKDMLISFERENSLINIKVHNYTNKKFNGKVEIALFKASSGKRISKLESTLEVNSFEQKRYLIQKKLPQNNNWVLIATLYDKKSEFIIRNTLSGKKWKYFTLAKAEIKFELNKKENNRLIIKSDNPAYFIDLYHPKATFCERGFVLLPGEEKTVNINQKNFTKKDVKDIRVYTLNRFLSN